MRYRCTFGEDITDQCRMRCTECIYAVDTYDERIIGILADIRDKLDILCAKEGKK